MMGTVMAICVLICLPLWLGKIGPNPIYGYRSAFARSSPENWYAMNGFAAKVFLPFFAILTPADLFLNDKEIVWILLPGVILLLGIVRLREWQLKRRIKRRART